MPALFIKISRRELVARNFLAAEYMEVRDERSIWMRVSLAFGTEATMSSIAVSPFVLLREARKMSAGLCFPSWRADSFPRPLFPVLSSVSSSATYLECTMWR